MFTKKGASVIVAWVLLVGLSVALGMIVTAWVKQQAEDTSEYIVTTVQDDTRCTEVSMKAFVVYTANCKDLNVSNSGYHTIKKISIRDKYHLGDEDPIEVNLIPQENSVILNTNVDTEIELIPIIQSGNKHIGCAERKLVIECP